MMKGKVFIFSAPSGAGKSTVVNYLLGQYPQQFEFSVSATSRAPRGEEKDGVEYYFISAERFRELIAQDAFVEYEEVYEDRFYGTLKSEVERIWAADHVIIFDVDVKGGVSLKKYFGDAARSVLIVPPSMEILEQRLRGRGTDSEEAITERLAKARWELDFASGKFDRELVNDRLDNTFALARDIVDAFLNQ
jgi:guanylate kinase